MNDDRVLKRKKKTAKLNIRVSDSEFSLLNTISYEDDEPVSQIVRKAIKLYADKRKEQEDQ